MKREISAAALLLLLFTGAMLNISRISAVADAVITDIDASERAALERDAEAAEEKLAEAFSAWESSADYIRVFVRHSEADSTTDAFFEAFGVLGSEDEREITAAFDSLRYHITQIADMERLSPGSIL